MPEKRKYVVMAAVFLIVLYCAVEIADASRGRSRPSNDPPNPDQNKVTMVINVRNDDTAMVICNVFLKYSYDKNDGDYRDSIHDQAYIQPGQERVFRFKERWYKDKTQVKISIRRTSEYVRTWYTKRFESSQLRQNQTITVTETQNWEKTR